MQAILLAAILLFANGNTNAGGTAPTDFQEVDLIELNHRYLDDGRHQFDQLIFWKWSPNYRRYDAVGWVLFDYNAGMDAYPSKIGDYWRCRFDHYTGRRTVRARLFRETITNRDPECDSQKQTRSLQLRSILER